MTKKATILLLLLSVGTGCFFLINTGKSETHFCSVIKAPILKSAFCKSTPHEKIFSVIKRYLENNSGDIIAYLNINSPATIFISKQYYRDNNYFSSLHFLIQSLRAPPSGYYI
jgi:hypothetical protein